MRKNIVLKALAIVLSSAFMFYSCKEEPKVEELASKAAKEYYDNLLKGNYELFVTSAAGNTDLQESYRSQLVANAKQYVAQMKEEHKGINDVKVVTAQKCGSDSIVNVFLTICFADSVNEEIVVPMVLEDGKWLMRYTQRIWK